MQPLSRSMPALADQGVHYVPAVAKPGVGMQAKLITLTATATRAVVFADEDMLDMADTDYVVIVQGETASAAVHVDESTKTTAGFSILNGADTEVLNVLVIGRLAGQKDANGNI